MNYAPQGFFIGLMDFFSILLPGALLTYLLMGEVGPVVLWVRYSELASAEAWVAFLFASYLFGHLVFLLGSWQRRYWEHEIKVARFDFFSNAFGSTCEINWLDIVSSALDQVHRREMIARVILGEQKFVNTEAPRAIAGLQCFNCKAPFEDLRSFKCHN